MIVVKRFFINLQSSLTENWRLRTHFIASQTICEMKNSQNFLLLKGEFIIEKVLKARCKYVKLNCKIIQICKLIESKLNCHLLIFFILSCKKGNLHSPQKTTMKAFLTIFSRKFNEKCNAMTWIPSSTYIIKIYMKFPSQKIHCRISMIAYHTSTLHCVIFIIWHFNLRFRLIIPLVPAWYEK